MSKKERIDAEATRNGVTLRIYAEGNESVCQSMELLAGVLDGGAELEVTDGLHVEFDPSYFESAKDRIAEEVKRGAENMSEELKRRFKECLSDLQSDGRSRLQPIDGQDDEFVVDEVDPRNVEIPEDDYRRLCAERNELRERFKSVCIERDRMKNALNHVMSWAESWSDLKSHDIADNRKQAAESSNSRMASIADACRRGIAGEDVFFKVGK